MISLAHIYSGAETLSDRKGRPVDVNIVGWHLAQLGEPVIPCRDCGEYAHYLVLDEEMNDFNLCSTCLGTDRYNLKRDKIQEVFDGLDL